MGNSNEGDKMETNVKGATRITRNAIRRAGVKDATISSRLGYDSDAEQDTVVTVVTYPVGSDTTALRSQIDEDYLLDANLGSCAATIVYRA
jgi:hypothetical protein